MPTLASLWLDTRRARAAPALAQDLHADVCVVGAGITGLSAALELARAGRSVVVLEGRFVGAGATGYTTAKLSSLHGLTYAKLERTPRRGRRAHLRAGQPARHRAGVRAGGRARHGLRPAAQAEPDLLGVARRARARSRRRSRRRGGPGCRPRWSRRPICPSRSPRRCASPTRPSSTRSSSCTGWPAALEASRGAPPRGHVRGCRWTRLALPRPDRRRAYGHRRERGGGHAPPVPRPRPLLRALPPRALVRGGGALRRPAAAGGMYLSTESPAHSIRTHALDGRTWLLVGGESHKTGQGDARERYERLERWARERFGVDR